MKRKTYYTIPEYAEMVQSALELFLRKALQCDSTEEHHIDDYVGQSAVFFAAIDSFVAVYDEVPEEDQDQLALDNPLIERYDESN